MLVPLPKGSCDLVWTRARLHRNGSAAPASAYGERQHRRIGPAVRAGPVNGWNGVVTRTYHTLIFTLRPTTAALIRTANQDSRSGLRYLQRGNVLRRVESPTRSRCRVFACDLHGDAHHRAHERASTGVPKPPARDLRHHVRANRHHCSPSKCRRGGPRVFEKDSSDVKRTHTRIPDQPRVRMTFGVPEPALTLVRIGSVAPCAGA